MRVTLDTNILVRAAASPNGPAFRLLSVIRRAHTLVLSDFIIEELERVLQYPRIQARYRITSEDAIRFATNLAGVAVIARPVTTNKPICHDPDDDWVLYTAAAGKADILCTLNTRHFSGPEALAFCARHGIRIMTDIEALRELSN